MAAGGATHLLLDFFGTLADYSPSRTDQGYHRTHALARSLGVTASYQDTLGAWTQASDQLDRRAAADGREYSMDDAARACLDRLLGRPAEPAEVTALAQCYLAEWNSGVSYPAGMAGMAGTVRVPARGRLEHARLRARVRAPDGDRHRERFDAVITSIDVGWRKPDPRSYAAALTRLGIRADAAIFAGDSFEADYAGPVRSGLTAFLIDPHCHHDIPPSQRLGSLADLPGRLGIG
jgi:putative hydrolase of the HAD superfamily